MCWSEQKRRSSKAIRAFTQCGQEMLYDFKNASHTSLLTRVGTGSVYSRPAIRPRLCGGGTQPPSPYSCVRRVCAPHLLSLAETNVLSSSISRFVLRTVSTMVGRFGTSSDPPASSDPLPTRVEICRKSGRVTHNSGRKTSQVGSKDEQSRVERRPYSCNSGGSLLV